MNIVVTIYLAQSKHLSCLV